MGHRGRDRWRIVGIRWSWCELVHRSVRGRRVLLVRLGEAVSAEPLSSRRAIVDGGQVTEEEREALASVEERFDDHVGWAYRYGMVWNWEVFRAELHAAVMIVCGLDGSDVDPADLPAVQQLGERHRELEFALEQARLVATPTQDWPSYYRALWEHTARAGLIGVRPDAPAPLGLVSHDQEPPGIPTRMIMWMLRTGFQRAMAEVYRDAPIEDWSLLGPILQRRLTGN